MLKEEAVSSSPPPPSPSQPPRSISPARRSSQTQSSAPDRSRLLFIYLGTAAALLCASVILFVLYRQGQPSVSQGHADVRPVKAPSPTAAPAQASAPASSAPVVSPTAEKPKQQGPPPEPVQFRIKRSKIFEKVGPIRLRLLKANTRWNTCDLYINSGGPSYQKQAHLNKPVPIDLPDGSGAAELVVTSIKGDQVSGSVQQK